MKEPSCWGCTHMEGDGWCTLNDEPIPPQACDDFEEEDYFDNEEL